MGDNSLVLDLVLAPWFKSKTCARRANAQCCKSCPSRIPARAHAGERNQMACARSHSHRMHTKRDAGLAPWVAQQKEDGQGELGLCGGRCERKRQHAQKARRKRRKRDGRNRGVACCSACSALATRLQRAPTGCGGRTRRRASPLFRVLNAGAWLLRLQTDRTRI